MFKIPKELKIGPIVYKVVQKKNLGKLGIVTYDDCTIKIDKDADPQVKRVTLMHEATHVILFQMGEGKKANDEPFVERLSSSIIQLLQDNENL